MTGGVGTVVRLCGGVGAGEHQVGSSKQQKKRTQKVRYMMGMVSFGSFYCGMIKDTRYRYQVASKGQKNRGAGGGATICWVRVVTSRWSVIASLAFENAKISAFLRLL